MTRRRRLAALGLALVLGAALPPFARAADEEVRTVPARPGVTESFLLLRPEGSPVATVIIFAGGDGNLALTPSGLGQLQGNFLVRTRPRWVREGFVVAILDTPSDHPRGLWNFRTTKEHAEDVKQAIAAMREIAKVPVWLVGTSMGTLSAANGETTAKITLTNRSNHIAFFLRAEVTKTADGEEVLPITYEDNYITLYPHEARTLAAKFATSALEGGRASLRVEGYNVVKKIVPPSQ